jgi:hypothetical protein
MKPTLNALLLLVLSTTLVPGVQADSGCTDATLTGSYSFNLTGWNVSLTPDGLLDLSNSHLGNNVGTATFDGAGNFSTSFFSCDNGACGKIGDKGTYRVKPDCSGKLQLGKGKNAFHWGLAISNGGNQVYMIAIDPSSNVSGTATKQ